MRIFTGLFLFMLASNFVMAQGRVAYRHYVTDRVITKIKYGNPKKPEEAAKVTICPNDKHLRCNVSVKDAVISIDFHGFVCSKPSSCNSPGSIHRDVLLADTLQYFIDLRRKNLEPYAPPVSFLYSTWSYGLLTIPFKLRPGLNLDSTRTGGFSTIPHQASGSFNVGAFIGRSIGRGQFSFKGQTTYSFTLGAFFGPTAVRLEEGVVCDFEDFKKEIGGYKSITLPGLNYGIAAVVAVNNFGIVACLGFDTALGAGSGYWYYNEKPWFGIGIVSSLPI